jgi:hypothetical protein
VRHANIVTPSSARCLTAGEADLGSSHPRVPPRSSLTQDGVMVATGG